MMNAQHMASAMQNMILGIPSSADPFANTPGISKSVEYEGCIDGGVPNLKARSLSFFFFSPERQTYTQKIQGYDITITVPNKSTSQLYTEWLSSFGFSDTGSIDSRSLSFLRVRSGQYLSRALQPTKSSQDRFARMYSYTQQGTKGCVGSTYDIKARTVGEEKILELVPNTSITSEFLNIVTEDDCTKWVCADINGPHRWTTKITFTNNPAKTGTGTIVNVRTTMEPAGCLKFLGKNIPCSMLLPPCFLFGCTVRFFLQTPLPSLISR